MVLVQVEKEREALRFEMNKAAAQMKEADAAIAAQKGELDKLNQIITEADQVCLTQVSRRAGSHSTGSAVTL